MSGDLLTFVDAHGRMTRYPDWRILPDPGDLRTVGELQADSQRLDQLAVRAYGDPLRAWQVADGARVLDPEEALTANEGRVRITQAPFGGGGR